MTTGPKRTKSQRAADRAATANALVNGERQSRIAQTLDLSESQVSRDAASIRREWRAAAIRDFDEAVSIALAKIDEAERQYWRAWERSKMPLIVTHQQQRNASEDVDNGGATLTVTIRSTERTGTPAFLQGVLTCIDRRCKLLGLDAAQRHEHTGKDGGTIQVTPTQFDLSNLTDEQMAVLDALIPVDAA